jgi:hypothetical protein
LTDKFPFGVLLISMWFFITQGCKSCTVSDIFSTDMLYTDSSHSELLPAT